MRIPVERDARDHFVIRILAVALFLDLVGRQVNDFLGSLDHVEPAVQQLRLLAGDEVFLDHVFLGFVEQDVGLGVELMRLQLELFRFLDLGAQFLEIGVLARVEGDRNRELGGRQRRVEVRRERDLGLLADAVDVGQVRRRRLHLLVLENRVIERGREPGQRRDLVMQAELEDQENDKARADAANKHVTDHLVGKLGIEKENQIRDCRENGQEYVLKHGCS